MFMFALVVLCVGTLLFIILERWIIFEPSFDYYSDPDFFNPYGGDEPVEFNDDDMEDDLHFDFAEEEEELEKI